MNRKKIIKRIDCGKYEEEEKKLEEMREKKKKRGIRGGKVESRHAKRKQSGIFSRS